MIRVALIGVTLAVDVTDVLYVNSMTILYVLEVCEHERLTYDSLSAMLCTVDED